jgi:hypothetical protein
METDDDDEEPAFDKDLEGQCAAGSCCERAPCNGKGPAWTTHVMSRKITAARPPGSPAPCAGRHTHASTRCGQACRSR